MAIPHRRRFTASPWNSFARRWSTRRTSVCADEIMLNARLEIRLLSDFLEESEAHLSESPAHWVSACQRTVPEYPAPNNREHHLVIRSEPSLAAGEYRYRTCAAQHMGRLGLSEALEVRRTRANSHRGRVRRALCPSMSADCVISA